MKDIPIRTAICAWCGKEFSWQEPWTSCRKYCGSQCAKQAQAHLWSQANKRRYAAKVAAEPERICKVCGKAFKRVSGQSKFYCSPTCGYIYLLEKNKRKS